MSTNAPIGKIHFKSSKYLVVKVNRKSKARYAKGIEINDVIHYEMTMGRTTGGSNGNYALYVDIFRNGQYLTTASQNEVLKMFEPAADPIFDLIPIVEA